MSEKIRNLCSKLNVKEVIDEADEEDEQINEEIISKPIIITNAVPVSSRNVVKINPI